MTGLPVRTERLVHIYHTEGHDVAALSGVDLDVRGGEIVGLLGPSGAGKSTLLSLLGGMFRPSAGKIFLGDAEVSVLSERDLDDLRATRVSMMLQGAARNLVPYRNPEQNVAFAQRWARRRRADLPAPREILAAVGLADHARLPLAALPARQLQLAAVAVALAPGPGTPCSRPSPGPTASSPPPCCWSPTTPLSRGACPARSRSATARSVGRDGSGRSTPW